MAKTRPRVLLIASQDTKAIESQFLRDCLEEAGCDVVELDPSVKRSTAEAEIPPEAVAMAAGKTLLDIRAIGHEGEIQRWMIAGALRCALEAHRDRPLAGILSIGGSMGTTLGTAIMREFPYGMPKLMISTLASGCTSPYVGIKDIAMLHSVCDISGLNSISRAIFRNAAFGIAGMAKHYQPIQSSVRPLVLASSLGTTECCLRRLREALEEDGYEVMVFHTNGVGGQTLDAFAAEREVAAVVELSLVEINNYLNHGLCSAGATRSRAAIERGIPIIFVPGNVDFYMMPSQMAADSNPFGGRRFHVHNPTLTAVRTSPEDLRRLTDHLSVNVQAARGPIHFYIPLRGFSSHDSVEGHLYDPSQPPLLASYLENALPASVKVHRIDAHINDSVFADALTDSVRRMTRRQTMN